MTGLDAVAILGNGQGNFQAEIPCWFIHPVYPKQRFRPGAAIIVWISTQARAENFWVYAFNFSLGLMA